MNLENFYFVKNDDGYSLRKYNGNDKIVVIPDTFDGEPVVDIFKYSFEDNKTLVEVVMPDTIINICYSAFNGCEKLEKIVFSNQLKTISDFSFNDCKNLKEINLPNSLESIGHSAFLNCVKLQLAFFNGDKIKIHEKAFNGCKSLETVNIDLLKNMPVKQQINILSIKFEQWNKVSEDEKKELLGYIKKKQSIKKAIFSSDCHTGISILFSEKVNLTLTQLDNYLDISIKNQNTLVTATLLEYKNKNFGNIEIEEFNENKELLEIGLEFPTLKQFKEKWKCSKIEGGLRVSGYKGELTEEETIPKQLADGTKIIMLKPSTTNSFSNIKKLIIEAELTEILPKSFYFNSHLEEIILPDTVKVIGKSAFDSAKKLRQVKFPADLEIIYENAFWCCKFLESVTLFEGVKEIHEKAFSTCLNLKTVILPKSLEFINKNTFCVCSKLEILELYSTTKIEENTFEHCPKINICVKEN